MLIDQALNGVQNYSWTRTDGPDAYFGGGAEQFLPGPGSHEGKDYYAEFAKKGYTVSWNRTSLLAAPNHEKALGIFCKSNFPVWLDRNVYTENLETLDNDPSGGDGPARDLPGLKDMTLKAIDILHRRGGRDGFFLMSEAASIDKQMHALDYDRALGDLLELDDTVRATIEKLKKLRILDDTLIVVSADHGHGFGMDLIFSFFFFSLISFWLTHACHHASSSKTSSEAPTPSTWRRRRTTGPSATPSACTSGRACRSTRSPRPG